MQKEKTQKEIISKTLIWRFVIAIPLSTTIAMMYIDDVIVSIEISVIANIASTIFYYIYETTWDKVWNFLSIKK